MRIKTLTILIVLMLFLTGASAQSWQQYLDSAAALAKQKSADSAIAYYKNADRLLPADSLQSDTKIRVLTNIGHLFYYNKSQYESAKAWYLQARAVIKEKYGTASDQYAANANLLGQVSYFLQDFTKAEQFYKEAKDGWENIYGKNSRYYAAMCNALGVLYNDNGQFEKAEAQHLEARATRKQLNDSAAYAQSCNNLAAIYWNLGEYDKAEPLALEAKDIRSKVAGIPKTVYAISCVNLANIYRDMGKYEQAAPLYIEAKNTREAIVGKMHDEYALSCDILADLYFLMEDYGKAEPLYLEAKSIRQNIAATKTYFYGQSCSNLANLYRAMGQYEKAIPLSLEADSTWRAMGSLAAADIAINNNNLGAIYFAMGDNEKAIQYYLQARETWQKRLGESHPLYTENSLELARVFRNKNEISKADSLYKAAFAAQSLQESRIFSFTNEEEKQLYLQHISSTEDEYQSFYFDKLREGNSGQPYRIALSKRNQVLASSQQLRQLIFARGDSSLLQQYETWVSIKNQVAALYARGDNVPKTHLATLVAEADQLEKALTRAVTNFSITATSKTGWQEIQQQLQPGEAAIEFISFRYFDGRRTTDSSYYMALLLRSDLTEPALIPLFEKSQLDNLLRKNTDGTGINSFYSRGVKIENEDSSLSLQSYQLIWKPLEEKLQGISKIYFAAAGLLNRVSFAALPVDSNTVLSDRYQLVQLSSTALIADKRNNAISAGDNIYLFGGIQYSIVPKKNIVTVKSSRNGFNYLPGTEREVTAIAKTARQNNHPAFVLKKWEAKENKLKQFSGTHSPAILHIATHGFFFDDPGQKNNSPAPSSLNNFEKSGNPLVRSGLLFAGANDAWNGNFTDSTQDDGILTAYEVSNLYLPNTKLVVLSACETALGDIKGSEGVYGLQRSFKMAGVKNLIMSLWKVPDEETVLFMDLFYRKLFTGLSIEQSFREAQTAMKKKYRKEPYKWAAWILLR